MTPEETALSVKHILDRLAAPPSNMHADPIGPGVTCRLGQHGETLFELTDELMRAILGSKPATLAPPPIVIADDSVTIEASPKSRTHKA